MLPGRLKITSRDEFDVARFCREYPCERRGVAGFWNVTAAQERNCIISRSARLNTQAIDCPGRTDTWVGGWLTQLDRLRR